MRSLKEWFFNQPDKPVVMSKPEIDRTYRKFRIEIVTAVFLSYAVLCSVLFDA